MIGRIALFALTLSCAIAVPRASILSASDTNVLPRHAVFGAAVIDRSGAVTVTAVVAGSPAEKAGLKVGDAIASIDGTSLATSAAFLTTVHRLHAGDIVTAEILRDGTGVTLRVATTPASDEEDPQVQTIYDTVNVDGSLRRTLITVPNGATERRPAVMVLGGIGCFSIDVARQPETRICD